MRCHGVPLVTISRGRVVYENGVFMCAEGTGKFCPLRSFPDTVYKKLVQREKVRRQGRAHLQSCLQTQRFLTQFPTYFSSGQCGARGVLC